MLMLQLLTCRRIVCNMLPNYPVEHRYKHRYGIYHKLPHRQSKLINPIIIKTLISHCQNFCHSLYLSDSHTQAQSVSVIYIINSFKKSAGHMLVTSKFQTNLKIRNFLVFFFFLNHYRYGVFRSPFATAKPAGPQLSFEAS